MKSSRVGRSRLLFAWIWFLWWCFWFNNRIVEEALSLWVLRCWFDEEEKPSDWDQKCVFAKCSIFLKTGNSLLKVDKEGQSVAHSLAAVALQEIDNIVQIGNLACIREMGNFEYACTRSRHLATPLPRHHHSLAVLLFEFQSCFLNFWMKATVVYNSTDSR